MRKDITIRPECEKDFEEINKLVIRSFTEGTNYSDGKGEVALLRQNYVSTTNWVLVAGYLKQGETLENAAIREVDEETGQTVEKITYISSYYYEKKELLMFGFRCDVRKSDFNNSAEVDKIEWHKLSDAVKLLREGSIAQQLLQAIEKQK